MTEAEIQTEKYIVDADKQFSLFSGEEKVMRLVGKIEGKFTVDSLLAHIEKFSNFEQARSEMESNVNILTLKPKYKIYPYLIVSATTIGLLFINPFFSIPVFLLLFVIYFSRKYSKASLGYQRLNSDYLTLKDYSSSTSLFTVAQKTLKILKDEFEMDTLVEVEINIRDYVIPVYEEPTNNKSVTTNSGYTLSITSHSKRNILNLRGKTKTGIRMDIKVGEITVEKTFKKIRRKPKYKKKFKKNIMYDIRLAFPKDTYQLKADLNKKIRLEDKEKYHLLRLKEKKAVVTNLNETAETFVLLTYLKTVFEAVDFGAKEID